MDYRARMQQKLDRLRTQPDVCLLAVESSCDETACSVLRNGQVLSNVVASQIEIHRRFGGVVPEIASRNHTLAIGTVVSDALAQAHCTLDDIDCFAVTYGAGLLGALLVGVAYVKALAYATDKPLIAVNHIRGHIAANYLADNTLEPPYICLIASGGHTAVAQVVSYTDIRILGQTQDDACGEAFDKVARVLGLPYPGGPQIEKLAREGKPVIPLPHPLRNADTLDFSFSGIKTAVINYVRNLEQKGQPVPRADIAASFQELVTDWMTDNAVRAAKQTGLQTVVIAGGVGANTVLRDKMRIKAERAHLRVLYPPLGLCTDNAAMIASQAYRMLREGCTCAGLDLDADADVRITDIFGQD